MTRSSASRKLATLAAALCLFAALAQLPGEPDNWWSFGLFLGTAVVWGVLAVINPNGAGATWTHRERNERPLTRTPGAVDSTDEVRTAPGPG